MLYFKSLIYFSIFIIVTKIAYVTFLYFLKVSIKLNINNHYNVLLLAKILFFNTEIFTP